MKMISITRAPSQIGKLIKGQMARVKQGSGMNLIVNPSTYELVSRSFRNGKSAPLQLSEEEIGMNASLSPEQHKGLKEQMLEEDGDVFDDAGDMEGGSLFGHIKKALKSKTAKRIGKVLRPIASEMAHQALENGTAHLKNQVGNNHYAHQAINGLSMEGHRAINGNGVNVHHALRLANMATAKANQELSKMHNYAVHGMMSAPPIHSYYDSVMAPISRGSGVGHHMTDVNLVQGRGSHLSRAHGHLPPAMESQAYGANWHMQFFLPPQYHKYNDGTDMNGRGLYL